MLGNHQNIVNCGEIFRPGSKYSLRFIELKHGTNYSFVCLCYFKGLFDSLELEPNPQSPIDNPADDDVKVYI